MSKYISFLKQHLIAFISLVSICIIIIILFLWHIINKKNKNQAGNNNIYNYSKTQVPDAPNDPKETNAPVIKPSKSPIQSSTKKVNTENNDQNINANTSMNFKEIMIENALRVIFFDYEFVQMFNKYKSDNLKESEKLKLDQVNYKENILVNAKTIQNNCLEFVNLQNLEISSKNMIEYIFHLIQIIGEIFIKPEFKIDYEKKCVELFFFRSDVAINYEENISPDVIDYQTYLITNFYFFNKHLKSNLNNLQEKLKLEGNLLRKDSIKNIILSNIILPIYVFACIEENIYDAFKNFQDKKGKKMKNIQVKTQEYKILGFLIIDANKNKIEFYSLDLEGKNVIDIDLKIKKLSEFITELKSRERVENLFLFEKIETS